MARHRYDMIRLSRHGVVGIASRQVLNVCKEIVYACRPDMAGRIFTHLSQIVYKLPVFRHTGRHDRSRHDVVYLYKMCAQSRGRSEQLVATGRATGSPRFLFQPCRAIIMSCRGTTSRYTYVTNELYYTSQSFQNDRHYATHFYHLKQ